jgi:hypothetical protein
LIGVSESRSKETEREELDSVQRRKWFGKGNGLEREMVWRGKWFGEGNGLEREMVWRGKGLDAHAAVTVRSSSDGAFVLQQHLHGW